MGRSPRPTPIPKFKIVIHAKPLSLVGIQLSIKNLSYLVDKHFDFTHLYVFKEQIKVQKKKKKIYNEVRG